MSDNIPTPSDVAPPAQAPGAAPLEPKVETDWKAEARKWEDRAKENKSAADRLAEIEAANQTEAEKAAARLAQAEKDAAAAKAEATRYRIATESKLSPEHAALLEHVTSEDGMRLIAAALGSASSDSRKQGNHAPREGNTPPRSGDDDRGFVRELFGRANTD